MLRKLSSEIPVRLPPGFVDFVENLSLYPFAKIVVGKYRHILLE